jgi:arsenate reductase
VPEVLALADRLGRPLREILRRKEPPYRALNLAEADDVTLAAAVAENPILLERPILDTGTRAILGRPPEASWCCSDRIFVRKFAPFDYSYEKSA